MFHNFITLLATTAVAIHALLGCCVHHSHSCDLQHSGPATVVAERSAGACPHHDHHGDDGEAVDHDSEGHEGHGHNGHQHNGPCDSCHEPDCSFVSVERHDDVKLMLSYSMWCQAFGNASMAESVDGLVSLTSVIESSPDHLPASSVLHAQTQVWRL